MASKKINSKSTSTSKSGSTSLFAYASKFAFASAFGFASASAKTDGSKFCIVVENIFDVTAGNMRLITRSQAKLMGNKAHECRVNLLLPLVLSLKCVKSPAKAAKEDIAEMVERVLAQLSLSTYKKPSTLVDDDVLSTGSTPQNILLVKAGYNPTEPSKLGKLPLEPAARQQCEGLGYKQPPPIRISIKRASNNYITVEDESATSNKMSSIFNRLGISTKRIFVFERLGSLRKKTKVWRNNKSMEVSALPKSQNAPKDFQSLIPSRMQRQTNIVVSCGEVLKAKSHVVVYTKQRVEDEESVGSSYHVTVQDESELQEDVDGLRTHVINGKLYKKYYP
uniref:Uncharacterized protein n=1 Tax=Solanum tuberosum TaxID=4113 RepID=M1D9U1_SOLTU